MTVECVDVLCGVDVPDLDGVVVGAADDDVVDGEDRADSGGVTVECVDALCGVDVPDLDGLVPRAADDDVVDGEDREDSGGVTVECFSGNDVHFVGYSFVVGLENTFHL